jgi:hypothetical protein
MLSCGMWNPYCYCRSFAFPPFAPPYPLYLCMCSPWLLVALEMGLLSDFFPCPLGVLECIVNFICALNTDCKSHHYQVADDIHCTTGGIWPSEYGLWYDLHVGCMSIISRRLILISSVALFKLLLTIWNCSPSNRLRVHWKLKARHLYKTIAYPSRWLGRKVRSNCLSNVWLPCVVLWWHCYYTTRNVSRVWSPRDLSSTPVTLTLTWLTSKGKWSNWLCAFTWRIVWYHISFLRLSMRW